MKRQLATAISQALQQIGASVPCLYYSSQITALYEGFVFSCVIEALTRLGATLEVRDEMDQPSTVFEFHTKPSLIFTQGSYYILVGFQQTQYELHTNLRAAGYSGTLHELDVCLLKHEEAQQCRDSRQSPIRKHVVFFAECKCYQRPLPLHIGREYLGLAQEFNVEVKTIISNVGSNPLHQLITKHGRRENFHVSPRNPGNVVMFVEWLANELRQVL